MTANERREGILNTLLMRRHDTSENLAHEFGVSERTIRNDVLVLSCSFPIETRQGKYGGGIYIADWYHQNMRHLSTEQVNLLKKVAPSLKGEDLQILNSIISQFAPYY